MILGCFAGSASRADFSFQTYRNRNSPDFVLLDTTREDSKIEENPFLNSIIYHYFSNPIAYDQQEDGRNSLVPAIHNINFATEYSPRTSVSIGAELPIHQLQFYGRDETFALGDMRFYSKLGLAEDFLGQRIKLTLIPSLFIPTGHSGVYLSNSSGGTGVTLAAQKEIGALMTAVNFGTEYFPHASFRNVNYDLQLFSGAGVKLNFTRNWRVQLEGAVRQIHDLHTGDLYLGAEHELPREQTFFYGASLASSDFDDGPVYRLMLGGRWSPAGAKVVKRHTHTKVETVQTIQTVHDCGPKTFQRRFKSRSLNAGEIRDFNNLQNLPYLSTPEYPIATLGLGGKTHTTPNGDPYVRNAQVLFAIDIEGLPPKPSVISLEDLTLVLKATKSWKTESEKADMICLLTEKICSGDFPRHATQAKNINSAFFMGKEPPNDFFMREISRAPVDNSRLSKSTLMLPLEKLLENSTYFDRLSLIYRDEPSTQTLYFAVSKNIYVTREAGLLVRLNYQACTETKVKPTTEIFEEKSKVIHEELPNE